MIKTLLIIALSIMCVALCVYLVLIVKAFATPSENAKRRLGQYFGIAAILFAAIVTPIVLLQFKDKNNQTEMRQNPFFTEWDTLYGVPPFDHR